MEDVVRIVLEPVGLHWIDGSVDDPARASVVASAGDRTWTVPMPEWRSAVHGFADRVEAFYQACAPRQPAPDDVDGFRRFREEWRRRRQEGPAGR